MNRAVISNRRITRLRHRWFHVVIWHLRGTINHTLCGKDCRDWDEVTDWDGPPRPVLCSKCKEGLKAIVRSADAAGVPATEEAPRR